MSEPGTAEWRRTEAERLITFGRAAALADGDNGGWFTSVDLSGQVNDFTKTNYAHAHTLLAAAGDVTGNPDGTPGWLLEAATALFDTAVADAWSRDGHPGFIQAVLLPPLPLSPTAATALARRRSGAARPDHSPARS